MLKMNIKPTKIIKQIDSFTNLTPRQQLSWWWNNFYKPLLKNIGPSVIGALIIGSLMQLSGKYTTWEITITIFLVFISIRINSIANILSRIEMKLGENKNEKNL